MMRLGWEEGGKTGVPRCTGLRVREVPMQWRVLGAAGGLAVPV